MRNISIIVMASAFAMTLATPVLSAGDTSSPDSASKAEKTREGSKTSAPGSAAVPAGDPSETGNATQQSRTKKD